MLKPQQKLMVKIGHAASPMCHVLCDHNTGTGNTLVLARILNKELHLNVLEFLSDAHVIDTMRLLTWPDKYQIRLQRARGDRLMAVGWCVCICIYDIFLYIHM